MSVSRAQLEQLLKKQRKRCALPGRDLHPGNVSLDHVWPMSKGGSSDVDNVQLVTREANAAKGGLTPDEFLRLCQDVLAEERRKKRRKTRAHKRARARAKRRWHVI